MCYVFLLTNPVSIHAPTQPSVEASLRGGTPKLTCRGSILGAQIPWLAFHQKKTEGAGLLGRLPEVLFTPLALSGHSKIAQSMSGETVQVVGQILCKYLRPKDPPTTFQGSASGSQHRIIAMRRAAHSLGGRRQAPRC